jgi:hypothetical protein
MNIQNNAVDVQVQALNFHVQKPLKTLMISSHLSATALTSNSKALFLHLDLIQEGQPSLHILFHAGCYFYGTGL